MEMSGKYKLIEKLGEGAFGPYYHAQDTSSRQNVMLITLGVDIPWDPLLKERFTAECAALRSLRHPNVAAAYEHGEDRKVTYLVTEMLPLKDLKSLITEHSALTLERKLAVMVQVAAGMEAAHAAGVLHRCLHPGDIRLMPDGTAKISGFLCGNIVAPGDRATRKVAETDFYLSPEQLRSLEATPQSDIFSLGLIFYELFTGVHPFHDDDGSKTIDHILHQAQVPTVEQFPNLPFNLWPVLERCLAKAPEERYASAHEFGMACQAILEELAEDSECMRIELQTALPRLRKAVRRRDAPPALKKLLAEVEQALSRAENSDYQSLNRLILTLAELHRLLDAPAEDLSEANLTGEPTGQPTLELCPNHQESDKTAAPVPAADPPAIVSPGEPTAWAESSVGQHAVHSESFKATVASTPLMPPSATVESPGLPLQANEAQTTPARVNAAGDPVRTRPAPRDSFSELLRKIDQGQEGTRKLVDNFLAGRRSKSQPAESRPNREGSQKPAEIEPRGSSPTDHPAEAAAKSAPPPETESPGQNPVSGVHAPPVENPLDAGANRIVPKKSAQRRIALWVSAASLVLVLAVALPGARKRLITGIGDVVVKHGRWINTGKEAQAPAQQEDPMAVAVRNLLNFARRDILLEEAEILHVVGRPDEARVFLNRLLELYPDYAPALQEREEIKAEAGRNPEQDGQQPIEKLLGNASSAIRSGNLQRAKTDLDAADLLQPGLPQVARLRKSLEARKAELAQNASREMEVQLAARKQMEAEALAVRVEDYYRQGRYDETLALVDDPAAQPVLSPQMHEIRNRSLEMKQSLRIYETALSAGRVSEARAALDRIERINPADPNLPALRKRAEQPPSSASASLSVYPLLEPAALLLDDLPVGTGGELTNQTIAAGKHKLVARGSGGRDAEMTFESAGGQAISLVYDISGQVLRAMNEADRARVNKSRARTQVRRFEVEHSHGLLRGSCKGELAIDYYHVVFHPATGPHGFSVSFKEVSLRLDNKNAVLFFAASGDEFFTFRLPDVSTAQQMRKLWDDLTAFDK